VLEAMRRAGYEVIRGFGEMVDILNRGGNLAAAIRLEELWNELLAVERISLLCAYAVDAFDRGEYAETLPRIGGVHSHLMPVEDGERLERAIDRAFIDVFGIHGDTRLLRELFVRDLPDRTAMPAGHGALIALRELDARLADAVLERAGGHYRSV
jgi:MEDS: MEthanogen/methylotroph, DcmR Sensory domain